MTVDGERRKRKEERDILRRFVRRRFVYECP